MLYPLYKERKYHFPGKIGSLIITFFSSKYLKEDYFHFEHIFVHFEHIIVHFESHLVHHEECIKLFTK